LNAQTCQCELSLAVAVHQLDTGDRDRRIFEVLEADHHSDALLYASMVLANRSTHLHHLWTPPQVQGKSSRMNDA
jgi:hypothetical protein